MDATTILLWLWGLFVDTVLVPVLMGAGTVVVGAAGGWLLAQLPGPVRTWLQAKADASKAIAFQSDMGLLLGAMLRKAGQEVGAGRHPSPTVLIEYVRKEMPDRLARLAPSPEAFATMASNAATEAVASLAPVMGANMRAEAGGSLTDFIRAAQGELPSNWIPPRG